MKLFGTELELTQTMTTATGSTLKHTCMALEAVIPGLLAWGIDRFSVWGEVTHLCDAQVWRTVPD